MYEEQDDEQSDIAASPVGNPARNTPPTLPTGTVTFLFTDIEGSTPLWERYPQAMQRAFSRQETIVRAAMVAHGGYVYKMIGDAFQVAFAAASTALAAALAAQRALHAEEWGPIGTLRVRIALHTGVTEERGDDYVGPELNRIARLLSAGHGGQVLLSQATADLVRDYLPEDVSLRDLGEHTLRGLIRPERIYQVVALGLPEAFPALRTVDTRFHNLPSPATPFVGREAELARIAALLQDPQCRLISLVWLGGSGKTRLAIQAAAQLADRFDPSNHLDSTAFPHGVYFVGLAAIASPEGMVAAIADVLHIHFYVPPGSNLSPGTAQAQLLSYLADKEALLVLDNLEQLIGFASLIADLLAIAPGVKLIVTSRERLNLPGEWVLEVAGLSFPAGNGGTDIRQYAAVQLFLEGAKRTGPFDPVAADWSVIASICQLLGGMPLGVEMAAAWTKVLSCQEIAAELERDLLALIATWRTVPERHRTLRIVFDHSWCLLSDEERDVFCRLSVFRSGFRREAAAEVAGASLSLLGMLIDKSLLYRTSERRFEIHPALRQYAAERLSADPAVRAETRSRHARYYAAWLSLMNERLKGSEQLAALTALRVENRNLHDAWGWLIEQRDLERLHGVLPAMILFHQMGGWPAGAQEVTRLLLDMLRALGHALGGGGTATAGPTAGSPDASLLALGLAALRHFDQTLQHVERTDPYQRESLAIAQELPDDQEKAFILLLNSLGPGALAHQQSLDLCQQCVGIFQRLGDAWGTALAQLLLADAAIFWGVVDAELARRSYQSGLEGFARLGNEWGRALCLTGLAKVERQAGHLEEAYQMACQGLDIYCRMGDVWRAVFARHALAEIAEELSRFDEARHYLEANLAHFSQMGDEHRREEYRERLERLDVCARTTGAEMRTEETPTPVHPPALPSRPSAGDLVEPLSARELEILHLLAEELTNREIAEQLYLSPNTVRVHTFHIYGKLGVNNRTRAVAQARSLGLLASS
jgi:class 3 adenylate cyclase/predicted ATPase/DNA-binding CsgD family transcriptional regulator